MKTCRRCQEDKEISLFVNSKVFKDGKDTICLECSRQKVKEWRKKNKGPHSKKRKGISQGYRDIVVDFLIKRDGLVCGICKTTILDTNFHIDHILPVALGGLDTMENVQLAHSSCNIGQSHAIRKQSAGY